VPSDDIRDIRERIAERISQDIGDREFDWDHFWYLVGPYGTPQASGSLEDAMARRWMREEAEARPSSIWAEEPDADEEDEQD